MKCPILALLADIGHFIYREFEQDHVSSKRIGRWNKQETKENYEKIFGDIVLRDWVTWNNFYDFGRKKQGVLGTVCRFVSNR